MTRDRSRRYLRFFGARPDADVEDEIAFHLEMRERELVARGMEPEQACEEARRRFGDRARVESEMRRLERQRARHDARRADWQTLHGDVSFVIRTLVRQPVFALSVILTLGLSIGANASIFSAVNALLLKPLPVRTAERLTVVAAAEKKSEMIGSVSYPVYREVKELPVIEDAVAWMGVEAALRTDGDPARGFLLAASDNYFAALGVLPALGRFFTPAEAASRAPVLAISHAFWERAFARDPGVIGRTIHVNETPFTIIGVLPEGFRGTQPLIIPDAVIPVEATVTFDPSMQQNLEKMGWAAFRILAYTKPGVTLATARASLGQLNEDLTRRYPAEFADQRLVMEREIRTRPEFSVSRLTPWIAGVFYGMVVLALLVSCANVANLLLVRATVRRGEIALRSALGASPARVVRLLLTESVVLGAASLGVAYLLSRFCVGWLNTLPIAVDFPVDFGLELDGRVFAYTAALSLLAGVLSGLAPALLGARADVADALRDSGRGGSAGPGRARTRSALVVAQVAVSFLLLVCGGLFIRSAQGAAQLDLGFTRDRILLAQADLALHRVAANEARQLQDRLVESISALPGVERVALSTFLPMSGNYNYTPLALSLDEPSPQAPNGFFGSAIASVSPGYISALGLKLLAGRDFTPRDDSLSPGVLIVNQAFVDAIWPGKDPIGRTLRIAESGPPLEIVGVVGTATAVLLGEAPRPMVFRALRQSPSLQTTFIIKSRGADPSALIPDVRRVVAAVDSRILLYGMRSMANHLDQGIALFFVNIGATLATAIGLLGLLLTIVGLYGVLSYSVAQRSREFGIRMALGARAGAMRRQVLQQSARLVALGLCFGGVVSLLVSRAITGVLVGVSPTDVVAYGGAAALVAALALASSWFPAWRASRVPPAVVVRGE